MVVQTKNKGVSTIKKNHLKLLNCQWILTERNMSKITVMIEKDLRRWKQTELCLKALGYFDQSKKVPQSRLCLFQQGRNGAALIPPAWASNPQLGSNPLELGSSFYFLNYCRAIGNTWEDDEEWWQLYRLPIRWCVRQPAQTLVEMILWRRDLFPGISRARPWKAVKLFLVFFLSL